ncbi:MAG: hypothetical protein WDN08_19505 [Rhizomicrobium sp.]
MDALDRIFGRHVERTGHGDRQAVGQFSVHATLLVRESGIDTRTRRIGLLRVHAADFKRIVARHADDRIAHRLHLRGDAPAAEHDLVEHRERIARHAELYALLFEGGEGDVFDRLVRRAALFVDAAAGVVAHHLSGRAGHQLARRRIKGRAQRADGVEPRAGARMDADHEAAVAAGEMVVFEIVVVFAVGRKVLRLRRLRRKHGEQDCEDRCGHAHGRSPRTQHGGEPLAARFPAATLAQTPKGRNVM